MESNKRKRSTQREEAEEQLRQWGKEYFLTKSPMIIAANQKEIPKEDTPEKETEKLSIEIICGEYYQHRIIEKHLYNTEEEQELL